MSAYTGSVPDTKRPADWRNAAACRAYDPEKWHPLPNNTSGVRDAKAICFGCPSMLACAQSALTRRIPDGIWGGLSEGQRTTLYKKYRGVDFEDINTVRTAVHAVLRDELNPLRSLRDVWDERTYPLPGGHIGWRGDSASFSFRGHALTPKQLAFLIDRGHKADGNVRRRTAVCPVVECVNPRHLADNTERCQQKQAAADTAVRAALAAAVEAELAS
jgi:transcription factor WhiB